MTMLEQELKEQRLYATSRLHEAKRFNRFIEVDVIGIEPLKLGEQQMECAKVYYDGLYGFIPKDRMDDYEYHSLDSFIGSKLEVMIEQIINDDSDDGNTKFIGNRFEALKVKSEIFWRRGRKGAVETAFISGVDRYNLYLLVNGVRVRMSKMDYSYNFIEDLREVVVRGDSIEVVVTEFNAEEKVLQVSRRALLADPKEFLKEYKIGGRYAAVINNFDYDNEAIFVSLLPHKITARAKYPAIRVGHHIKKGDSVLFDIVRIDLERGFIHGRIVVPQVGQIGKSQGKADDYRYRKGF